MFTKIMASILAMLMSLLSFFFPGFVIPGTEVVETGAFLAQVDQAFGYEASDATEAVLGVEPSDEYFAAVATAAKYDVLVDYETIDTTAPVDYEFVATVLVTAAGLEIDESAVIANADEFTNVAKLSTALVNGIITPRADAKVSTGEMPRAEVDLAVAAAVSAKLLNEMPAPSEEVTYNGDVVEVADYTVDGNVVTLDEEVEVGDTLVLAKNNDNYTGSACTVESVETVDGKTVATTSPADVGEFVESIDYVGTTNVDFTTAMIADGNGDVISNGYIDTEGLSKDDVIKTLKKLANVSFSVKGFKIKAKITDTGLDFSIAKDVCDGVRLEKAYSLTNLAVDAKADMDIKKLSFNEVYLNFDYDLVDTTTISGSYAKEFGDVYETVGEKINVDNVITNAIDKYILSSFDSSSIKLFSVTVPLGSTPLSVTFDILLNIDVNGKMTITVVTEEYHGVEIINNKVSVVNDSTLVDRKVDIYGEFSICLGLDVAFGLYGYNLVDVGVEGGLGAFVEATAKIVDADGNVVVDSTYTVPVDYLVELAAGMDFEGQIDIGGHAEIYGILRVSVGENSVIEKVGLSKTWTIYDRSNGTIAEFDF